MHREMLEDMLDASNSERDHWRRLAEHYNESLRDKFAMAAMTGMLAFYGNHADKHDELHDKAYQIADAMLEARKK